MKTFTIAGSSNLNGVIKNRFANGTVKVRGQILARNGHTDIKLVELPTAMTKADALAFLESQTIMTPRIEDIVPQQPEDEFDPMDDVNYVGHPIHY
jgi:predicted Holliday junction resolvase-like endonuclease